MGVYDWSRGPLSHVSLPLLEVLEMEAINFSDCQSFGMLLSACSSLKHLVLKESYGLFNWPLDVGRFNYLVTADVPKSLLPLKVISNVTFLRLVKMVRFLMTLMYSYCFSFTKLTVLYLAYILYLLSWQPDLSPCPDQPTFPNLTFLEYSVSFKDWETIFKYLYCCPKLEIFRVLKVC